ncbi:uncharacterized protein LOC129583123 [Paramacrobiotus metropolitanus]|uniref:uncharacterized protein LOC129583123 n=1 Tax=Paramacrobiotus metropolitanus TaxID=2943436 RepID=UPI0024456168|nr:uncharacterized protein LOC129583123 [Paramacrobiotus metropolitanus]
MKNLTSTNPSNRRFWLVSAVTVILSIIPVTAWPPFLTGLDFLPLGSVVYYSASDSKHCNNLVFGTCSTKWDYCSCNQPAVNFTVVPSDVTHLHFGDFYIDRTVRPIKCAPSCVRETFALPYYQNLTALELHDFWIPHDRPFPVGRFLSNFKPTLKQLTLHTVHLPAITKETFAGFFALDYLRLTNNRILTITVDAFTSLRAPSRISGILNPSRLNTIKFEGNEFTTLDWTIFEPLAGSLKSISLTRNNIHRIYFSHFFTMPAVEHVYLWGNHLTGIDNQLLYSLALQDLRPFLDIQWNPLCPADILCRCPSMDNLWEWYLKIPRYYTALRPGLADCRDSTDYFTCGNYSSGVPQPDVSGLVNTMAPMTGKTYEGCGVPGFAKKARDEQRAAKNPINRFFPPSLREYFLKITAALMKPS